MLNRLYAIIEKAESGDTFSKIYDIFMMVSIIVSIIPLCFIQQNSSFIIIDKVTVVIFIIDYILRFITADCEKHTHSVLAYIKYPFRFMAIIDLLSILPSVTHINAAFKALKLLRLFRTLRIFKFFRYSKNIQIIVNVLKREKSQLMTVGVLALAYIFVSALIVFQVEPETFGSLFRAFYWATISLTTVGYGDLFPSSQAGQIISMISSFLGVAVIALPSGIIVSGYSQEIHNQDDDEK